MSNLQNEMIMENISDSIWAKVNNGEANVTVNNLQVNNEVDQSLKNGDQTNVPLIASSNSNNMYSSYSQIQYVVLV